MSVGISSDIYLSILKSISSVSSLVYLVNSCSVGYKFALKTNILTIVKPRMPKICTKMIKIKVPTSYSKPLMSP